MARILISHCHRDAAVAHALAARLGPTATILDWARLETGESAASGRRDADLVVVLWSARSARSPWLRQGTQLALDAWAGDRLLLARLDATPPPLGLRDVDSLDATVGGSAAELIAAQVASRLARRSPPAPVAGRKPGTTLVAAIALALACLLAALLFLAVHQRAPSLPPTELPAQPEPSVPPATEWARPELATVLVFVAPALAVALLALAAWRRFTRRRSPAAAPAVAGDATVIPPSTLFVSYSHHDGPRVDDLVDALQHAGLAVWLDRRRNADGRRFAGPIVEAIRGAKACAFMCSSTAYASDHVVRELYLADKYDKPMIPVRLEDVLPTADFEYFFSGLDFVPCDPRDQCIAAIQHRMIAIVGIGNAS